ncbi:DNA glycosylase AlkZ-like family protein [Nocardioides litoris]|uniref:DNA glycosylase AlkZ-like family protein n=1 Tax=Nocardioides litoris TaxID=1926648 RepID=UPI001122F6DA|nr:crosslink repair DNA glycosylase YcaQ family protein [Nocardioides litoris]
MTPSCTWDRALAWRLGRHLLDPVGPAGTTPADVVRRLGAVLALDTGLAEQAVAARRTAGAPGDLAAARAEGSVVTVFSFRGSLHLATPEDVGVHLALRAAGRQWERRSWVEHYGLRAEDWPAFRAAVRGALAAGPLTVGELGAAVTAHAAYRHLRPVFDDGAGTLLKPLCWQGDLWIAPTSPDGRPRFELPELNPRWGGVPDLEDAGPRAVLDFVRDYGPVTTDHVHHWLGGGLSAGRARLDRWWTGLADELAAVEVEGTPAHVARDDLDALLGCEPSDAVRLLPGHDQWVMGVGTADEHVVPPALREAVTRKAGLVVRGGVVRGTTVRRGGALEVSWWDDGPRPDDAIGEEAARLGLEVGFSDRSR